MSELLIRCTKCGAPYDPNPGGPAPITCDCGAPFATTIAFTEDKIEYEPRYTDKRPRP